MGVIFVEIIRGKRLNDISSLAQLIEEIPDPSMRKLLQQMLDPEPVRRPSTKSIL